MFCVIFSKIFNKEFTLSLIDVEYEELTIPDDDFSVDIEMESKYFNQTIGELKDFGDDLEIICSEDKIQLNSTGDNMVNMNTIMKFDDILSYEIDAGLVINTTYNNKFLQEIGQFMKINDEIRINIKKNSPIKISCFINSLSLEDTNKYEELKSKKMKISKDVEKLKSKHKGIKSLYESYKSRIKKKEKLSKKDTAQYNKINKVRNEIISDIEKIRVEKQEIMKKMDEIELMNIENPIQNKNYLVFYLAPKVDE